MYTVTPTHSSLLLTYGFISLGTGFEQESEEDFPFPLLAAPLAAPLAADVEDLYEEAFDIAVLAAAKILQQTAHLGLSPEDIAQETMIKLFSRSPETLGNWRGWVRTVAQNQALDAVRRGTRFRQVPVEDASDPIDGLIASALRTAGTSSHAMNGMVVDAIASYLSPTDGELIRGLVDGRTAEDLVEDGRYRSINAARAAIARARQNVRKLVPADELEVLMQAVAQ